MLTKVAELPEVNPKAERSELHPAVTLVTMAAKVSLLHGATPQTFVSQESTPLTSELFPADVMRGRSDEGLKQADDGLVAI